MSLFCIRQSVQRFASISLRPGLRYCSNESVENSDKKKSIDPSKDRSKIIPVEVSMKYMKSKAYQTTYGDDPVWKHYRRNHKGGFAPRRTRESCIRFKMITTGNPCPICRDEYLVLDEMNTELLQQFVSKYTGQILDAFDTGLCRAKQKELLVAIDRAWDKGLMVYDVPFRVYDYKVYNKCN